MNEHSEDFARKDPGSGFENQSIEIRWVARKLKPSVLIYVLLVFGSFMALSQFVFHSAGAVKSLALAAIAAVVALMPQVLRKIEYQANGSGVRMRAHGREAKGELKMVFTWGELSHAVSTKQGFRYFKTLDEKRPVRRFMKLQFSDRSSGEIHVEAEDRSRVYGLLEERGVSIRQRG